MSVVFVVLSVLAISIKVFDRVDSMLPAEGNSDTATLPTATPTATTVAAPAEATTESADAETAAVIAVALALADAENEQMAGTTPRRERVSATGNWVSTGRSREMSSRMIGQPRRGRGNA
jgi:Na+-transporting methylmalonyl-CoA/oxaloacetate decarboxylase gamma subunit